MTLLYREDLSSFRSRLDECLDKDQKRRSGGQACIDHDILFVGVCVSISLPSLGQITFSKAIEAPSKVFDL